MGRLLGRAAGNNAKRLPWSTPDDRLSRHRREVKKAREDKEQATGFIGQLGQVRGESDEMKSAVK